MTFPNQPHIDHVNEVLWRNGGSGMAVMVGSGSSQDARNAKSNGRPVPILQDIKCELFRAPPPGKTCGNGMPRDGTTMRPGGHGRLPQTCR